MKQINTFMQDHPIKIAFCAYWALLLIFIYFAFVSLYPFKVFEMVEPIKFNAPVYAGETATYQIHFKKHRQVYATVHRQLVNGTTITMADIISDSPTGEHTYTSYIDIPDYVKPGTHQMIWTGTYELNFPFYTRVISIRYLSDSFEVKPPRAGIHDYHAQSKAQL